MGCSQPHPHGQIWAHDYLSTEVEKADNNQRAYWQQHNTNLLGDYVAKELSAKRANCMSKRALVSGGAFLGRMAF